MINYYTTAVRTITRNKVYSIINILGLTIGLSACMVVATVVIDDLSYDRQWKNSPRLYRILTVNKMGDGLYDRFNASFTGVCTRLASDYPEVKAVACLNNRKDRFRLSDTDPNGVEVQVLNADTAAWQMLDLTLVAGDSRKYVAGVGNIVLSESIVHRLFPGQNPVGKTIYSVPTFGDKPQPYLITGIIRDLPSNSVFRAEMIALEKPKRDPLRKDQSGTFTTDNYILVRPGTDIKKFEAKFNQWYTGFVSVKSPFQFGFQPLKDVYLHSDFAAGQQIKGDSRNIYIFAGIALLVLLIACVNYINLTTARAIQRLPETGVRKVLGAGRRQLIHQFLTESFLFFLIAAVLATLLYAISLPLIERYLGHPLALTFISGYTLFTLVYLTVFLISVLAGLYPAWILSGFKQVDTLKGKMSFTRFGSQQLVRKGLVVVQFSISIMVVIAMIVVRQQLSYIKAKDIGYNKNNLLHIGAISWDKKGEAFKNELLRQPGVVNASISSWSPPNGVFMTSEVEDPNHAGSKLTVSFLAGDVDLSKTLELGVISGRLLDKSYAADEADMDSLMQMDEKTYTEAASRESSVITAYTARVLGITRLNTPIKGAHTSPVGIVRDFNNESLKNPLSPTIIIAQRSPEYGGMLVRVAPGHDQQTMTYISKVWRKFFPEKLLEINKVSDMLDDQYKTEAALAQFFTFFSSLSMFLAALGILGLIIYATGQRRKEIGVRKVLGASVASIVRLFSFDFLKLILLALVLASPLAGWLMHGWLNDFAYRIRISPWIFLAAGLVTTVIALATISLQTVKAALDNPVKSLRTE
ncbi:MAG TPA: FtsX-like permease family protein [Puia sp.]|nr:FtsX-like permease family protein [Puia sp.]